MHIPRTTTAIATLTAAMTMAAKADTITILNYANYMPPDIAERFEKETGHKMELVTGGSSEEILSKVLTSNGAGYDVVFLSSNAAEPLVKMGLVGKLDHSKIPNMANLTPEATHLPFDKGNVYSIGYGWGLHGICYREDLVKKAPDSWWDLLKPSDDMVRKFTMVSSERNLLEPAQAVLGYSFNDTDPAHLEEVKKLLIDVKPKILAYDNVTMASRLVSGEIAMAQSWDNWCFSGAVENDKIKFIVPKEGADLFVDVMMVPEASEHKEVAHSFIDFVLKPENHSWVATSLFVMVPNEKAMQMVPKDLLEKYPLLATPPAELLNFESFNDLGDKQPAVTKVVTEILSTN